MKPKSFSFFILAIVLSCNQNKNSKTTLNTVAIESDEAMYTLDSVTLDSLNNGMYRYSESHDTCLATLEYYSHYWTRDSLGKDGFRELFGRFILKNCNCVGNKWTIVAKYLGRPNQSFISDNKRHYRYRLNYFSASIKNVGTSLLDIDVDSSGIITSFALWEVDG